MMPMNSHFVMSSVVIAAFYIAMLMPVTHLADDGSNRSAKSGSKDAKFGEVLIIPYDPGMYFSDADEMLAESNNKSEKEVRNLLRYGLNSRVKAQIIGKHGARSLLTDTTKQAYKDLQRIYQAIKYQKAEAMAPKDVKVGKGAGENSEQYRQEIIDKMKENEKEQKKEEEEQKTQAEKYKEQEVKGRYYIDVDIPSNKMLKYFKKNYGTELFLFLNQFELITNYNHCLDRSTNTFERTIKVHYSLYNAEGKQLAGDVAIVKFPSNSNDLYKIIRKNFPIVGEYVSEDLPAYGEANAEGGDNQGN